MYKTIIMPVDVFEMELSDKAVRHAEFLAQQDGIIHLLHVLPGACTALPPTCVALRSIYSTKPKRGCRPWSGISASTLPASKPTSGSAAFAMPSMSWPRS